MKGVNSLPRLPFGKKYHRVGWVLQPGGTPSEIPLCPPKFLTAHNSSLKWSILCSPTRNCSQSQCYTLGFFYFFLKQRHVLS